jgi:hypothetical protein
MMTKTPDTVALCDEIEVLIPEARERARRRRIRAAVVVACLMVAGAVGAAAAVGWTSGWRVAGGPSRHVAISLARNARVSGFIYACYPEALPAGAPMPPSQAGVIEVLRGHVRSGPVIAGAREFVLPAGPAVATERVGAGQRFSFLLRPGRYALLARFALGAPLLLVKPGGQIVAKPFVDGGTAVQFVNVSLRSGENPVQSIPSGCL